MGLPAILPATREIEFRLNHLNGRQGLEQVRRSRQCDFAFAPAKNN